MNAACGLDLERSYRFLDRVMADMSGTFVSALCSIGDRLGLFDDLAANGPATVGELAERTTLDERYLRDWLHGLSSAGYLEHDSRSDRFVLPREHAALLAAEGETLFMGGAYQQLLALLGRLEELPDRFRDGGGIAADAYGPNLVEGIERADAGWFRNHLVQEWIPRVPGLESKLERGAAVADVRCRGGLALVSIARAFPRSVFTGCDWREERLARARSLARSAGVHERVSFARQEANARLTGPYDLIVVFDVLHAVSAPIEVLRAVREALAPDGCCLLLETWSPAQPERNRGPVATALYGASVLYTLPASLAAGAEGVGRMGIAEPALRELCQRAGLSRVRLLPIADEYRNLYEVRA
jgi:SAM-dependent methyltransferase